MNINEYAQIIADQKEELKFINRGKKKVSST